MKGVLELVEPKLQAYSEPPDVGAVVPTLVLRYNGS